MALRLYGSMALRPYMWLFVFETCINSYSNINKIKAYGRKTLQKLLLTFQCRNLHQVHVYCNKVSSESY